MTENHNREYFFISLLIFASGIWLKISSHDFNINHEPSFISINKIHIPEEKLILVKYNRYGGFLIFDINGKIAQVECNRITSSSDEYKKICNRRLSGSTIKASNIDFLDARSPKLEGIFLSGKFTLGNEVINLNIHHNKKAIDNYIFRKKIDIIFFYTFLFGSFLSSVFFFLKLKD